MQPRLDLWYGGRLCAGKHAGMVCLLSVCEVVAKGKTLLLW